MQSQTVGQILKQARTEAGLSLTEVSAQTKIKLNFLKALEADQFKKLPAATFVKGFIRTYARILDLDDGALLALLRRDFKQSASGKLLPREFIHPVIRKNRLKRPVTLAALTVSTVFIVLFGYVAFQWYQLNRPPHLQLYYPENDQFVSAEIVVEGQTEPEAMVSVNAQPVSIKPDGSFQTQVYLPKEGISTITVEATDKRGKTSLEQRTVYVRF
ncbi:MAG: helix-turn-helix domain-containing protein [Candidatus Pacebacteria bacterium]|nr:helix-turn-helix domain-containing protein [Candidatus Paceibacterota bacterium]